MKKVLYFMPDLSLKDIAGNITRVISLLEYFKNRGIEVDYFGVKDWCEWKPDSVEQMMNTGLVNKVIIGKRRPSREQNLIKRLFTYKIPELLKNIWYGIDNAALPNKSTFYLKKQFDKLLKENTYDYIIINYSLWANLVRNRKHTGKARIIIDTHDLMTIQMFQKGKKPLYRILREEMRRLNYFDEVWAVSMDEMYLFTQLLKNQVKLVPNISLSTPSENEFSEDKKYDLIYVASENGYNKEAAAWFMQKVYPLLPSGISICIVGLITKHIEDKSNIIKFPFIENLNEVYTRSKVVICPMLNGTGTKLKVIEAMAYGLPIVCTLRGIDGLPNKINNGCMVSDTPQKFADNIISILSDKLLYATLSKQSSDLYKNYFAINVRYKQLDQIFDIEKQKA